MSNEIPYFFCPIPYELLEDAFLEDVAMMKFIRYIFKTIRPYHHFEVFSNNRRVIRVELKPYEFVYGRIKTAERIGITEDVLRPRSSALVSSKIIEKCPSSSTSTFTVYRVMTEGFSKNKPQQLPQQLPHKEEYREEKKEEKSSSARGVFFCRKTNKFVGLTESVRSELVAMHSHITRHDEHIERAARWLITNEKGQSRIGNKAFINNWLRNASDSEIRTIERPAFSQIPHISELTDLEDHHVETRKRLQEMVL